jgi:DNA polymerase III subunit epsilon
MSLFAAIDFETANYSPDSACAVGLVMVKGKRIIHREQHLIRPPYRDFVFTYIHGLTWEDVQDAATFSEVWPKMHDTIKEVSFLAAHNASFDRKVLEACCQRSRRKQPSQSFLCTVKLARSVWNIHPAKLPNVCSHLKIPLQHHKAISDAEACARIVIAARKAGWQG